MTAAGPKSHIGRSGAPPGGAKYQWFGWTVSAVTGDDISGDRLTETHEYFHRQLDDTTAFGGLTQTLAALAEAQPERGWDDSRNCLQDMSDLVHETFAVGMSLLTNQRRLNPIEGYPLYDRYVELANRLLGEELHPWVALAGLRAAATACMQSPVLAMVVDAGLRPFDPMTMPRLLRPNHRLVGLLEADYAASVQAVDHELRDAHGSEQWWLGYEGVILTPESMDGETGDLAQETYRRLFDSAAGALRAKGADVLKLDGHHLDLATVLGEARDVAPEGLTRIGALIEMPDAELLHGGALDSQTIMLSAAPIRATVLPYGSVSGLSGSGDHRHGFLTLVRPERIRNSYELQGIALPEHGAVSCLRTTVFDGTRRDSVLFVLVDSPDELVDLESPIYVSISSSAAGEDPDLASKWMLGTDPERLSLVMDTPFTVALHRWCKPEGTQFRTASRAVIVGDMEVRIIAGRINDGLRQSALVIVPTTEFGARWYEAAIEEDPALRDSVIFDDALFDDESHHLDVVLSHILLEERLLGPGSWRQ